MAEPIRLNTSKGRSFAYQSSLMSLYNFLEKVEREAQVRFDEEMKINLLHQFDNLYLDADKKLNILHTSGDLSEKGYDAQTRLLDDIYRRMHAALGHKTTLYGKRQQKAKKKRAKKTIIDRAQNMITSDKRVLRRLSGKEDLPRTEGVYRFGEILGLY